MISVEELKNGEKVGLGAIEIVSIPHISVLNDVDMGVQNPVMAYKQDMSRLLSEVYQIFQNSNRRYEITKDVSLEILWSTSRVENQPYSANISLFLIIRSIGSSQIDVMNMISSIMEVCKGTLDFERYEYKTILYEDLSSKIKKISDESISAIVKEERIEYLQNPLLPTCFSYERLPVTENDLGRIVNSLIEYPDIAISFSLIPVNYSNAEMNAIDKLAIALDTLKNGVTERDIGSINFSFVEKHAETYKYYSQNKHSALFFFNILVFGTENIVNTLSTRITGQLDSGTILRFVPLTRNEINKEKNFYPLPWAVHELLQTKKRDGSVWDAGQNYDAYWRIPFIITSEEASEFFRFPIGNDNISAGLNVNESTRVKRAYGGDIIGGGDIEIGLLKSASKKSKIGLYLDDLTKHMLIVGTPGSGKTTFAVGLLDRLWKEHQIPFLVIEPAKNEYRALIQSIPDIQIFTPGKKFISPFIFNPFVPPKNVKLEAYKSTLKTAFAAGVSMSTPLDKIFEESINNCYSDFGWIDSYTIDDYGSVFNISDFIKCFQETFNRIGYTGDARNIGLAGVVRLSSLKNLFDNYNSIPIEDLLKKPTIIELSAIENNDQKSLIISLLLLSILSYVNSNYIGKGILRNVILLEEAHVLLDSQVSLAQSLEADPKKVAQELFKRMLAEIRSYGVGIIVADQSPRKVTSDVVAMTDIKLAFRLVEAVDKQIIADSTNMSDIQLNRLAKFKPGESILFFGKLDEPEEVVVENYRAKQDISITLSDEEVKSLSTYWKTKQEHLRPYPECLYVPYCQKTCDFKTRALAKQIARRIFLKYFNSKSSDFKILLKVFGKISTLVKNELNGEEFSRKLLSCVKTNLWRKIKYETNINVSDSIIKNSLQKK